MTTQEAIQVEKLIKKAVSLSKLMSRDRPKDTDNKTEFEMALIDTYHKYYQPKLNNLRSEIQELIGIPTDLSWGKMSSHKYI